MNEGQERKKKRSIFLTILFIIIDIIMLKWVYWILEIVRKVIHWLTEKEHFWWLMVIIGLVGVITLLILKFIFEIPIFENIKDYFVGLFK